MPTVVFKLEGQASIGPSDVDQSWFAINLAAVPPPARKEALWLPPITSKNPDASAISFQAPTLNAGNTCKFQHTGGWDLMNPGFSEGLAPSIVRALKRVRFANYSTQKTPSASRRFAADSLRHARGAFRESMRVMADGSRFAADDVWRMP
jgi:hypothetical protein